VPGWVQAPEDNGLPPTGKWPGRTVPLATEGCPQDEAGKGRLVVPPPLGVVKSESSSQRGQSVVPGGVGFSWAPFILPGELLSGPEASVQDLVDGICSGATLFQPLPRSKTALSSLRQGEVLAALQAASNVYILQGQAASYLKPK
jgi:hypothetical protein